MFKTIVLIIVGIGYYHIISANEGRADMSVDPEDVDVKAAIVFAFGENTTTKDIEFVEGEKRVTDNLIYKLKVRINYYNECNDNETNIWIIQTDRGCKV